MRRQTDILELKPSLIGTLSYGLTACGAPVRVTGFKDVLAVLVAGAVQGTATNYCTLNIKMQESATAAGTGASWTDITDGSVNGSFDFDEVATFAGTWQTLFMDKVYERLDDKNRKAYIRAHATVSGTEAVSIKYSVAFLLGRPDDTLYITNATTHDTGNSQYGIGV